MIRSFKDRKTQRLFESGSAGAFRSITRVAIRKLDLSDSAASLDDLRAPPGNTLEKLRGGRSGRHSIRVNDQWRICFIWRNGDAHDVEIVDYH